MLRLRLKSYVLSVFTTVTQKDHFEVLKNISMPFSIFTKSELYKVTGPTMAAVHYRWWWDWAEKLVS